MVNQEGTISATSRQAEQSYTPGPWYVSGSDIMAEYEHRGDLVNRWVARVSTGPGDNPRMEDYANARLIAAAPRMLEALRDAAIALDVLAEDAKETGYPDHAESATLEAMSIRAILKDIVG